MTPIPTEWWLRPVSKAARVGAHSAVVWKRLYFKPFAASRSAVGVAHGPPNALDAAKPTSSSRMTSTFGAPAGGASGSIAGNDAAGSLASYGSVPLNGLSGIGKTSRGPLSVNLGSSPHHAASMASNSALRTRTAVDRLLGPGVYHHSSPSQCPAAPRVPACRHTLHRGHRVARV